jgi:hypothetical protein
LGHAQCIFNADNANLLTSGANEANLWHADALIDTGIADL